MASAMLSGCSLYPIQGQLRTKDNQPLLLSSQDEQLLLVPGRLSAEIGENPARHGNIRLRNDKGEIRITTRPEDFQYNHFLINSDQAKLSANIKGVWREDTSHLGSVQEVERCTTMGVCAHTVEVSECPNKESKKRDKDCIRYYETRMKFSLTCPGQRLVENTYQTYTRTLELEFLDTRNQDRLAQFEGSSAPRRRLVTQRELGPCLLE